MQVGMHSRTTIQRPKVSNFRPSSRDHAYRIRRELHFFSPQSIFKSHYRIMGDFSSSFNIINNLEVDLVVTENNAYPSHGYWLKWPDNGKVGLLSTSKQFQRKDYAGE